MSLELNREKDFWEDSEINLTDLFKAIYKYAPYILAFSVLMTLLVSVWAIAFYPDKYISESLISINNDDLPEYITQGVRRSVRLFDDMNPIKIQEEILKNPDFKKSFLTALHEQNLLMNVKSPQQISSKFLEFNQIKSTPFIKLTTEYTGKEDSQRIAKIALIKFVAFSNVLTKTPQKQQYDIVATQKKKAQQELGDVNNKIEYLQQNGNVDIAIELTGEVNRLISLKSNTDLIKSQMVEKDSTRNELQKQLGFSAEEGLLGIGIGSNTGFQNLLVDYNNSVALYDAKTQDYTTNHPYMKKLAAKIDSLKEQLNKQSILSVGLQGRNAKMAIQDDARSKLIQTLALANADYMGLQKKYLESAKQQNQLQSQLSSYPEKVVSLAELNAKKEQLISLINRLDAAMEDITIHYNFKPLSIVSEPSEASPRPFPRKWHIIGFAAVLSLLIPTTVAFQVYTYKKSELIEKTSLSKFLETDFVFELPWIENKNLKKYPNTLNEYHLDFANFFENKRKMKSTKIVGFSTILNKKRNTSSTINSLAENLGNKGKRILLIDFDSQSHSLTNGLNKELKYSGLFSQLQESEITPLFLKQFCEPSGVNQNVYYLQLGYSELSLNEQLVNPKFHETIEELKKYFDCILVDCSALTSNLLPNLSELLKEIFITIELKTTKKDLFKLKQKIISQNINVFGALLRTLLDD